MKTTFYLHFLLGVVLVRAEKRTFISRARASSIVNEIPRGGGLDKTTVAKTALTLVGAHGVVDLLSPAKSLEFYFGITKADDPMKEFMVLEMGGASLNYVLVPALQIFQGMSFETALGYSCLPYIFMTLYKLMNGKLTEVWYGASRHFVPIIPIIESYQ